jgi:hypothetical protein
MGHALHAISSDPPHGSPRPPLAPRSPGHHLGRHGQSPPPGAPPRRRETPVRRLDRDQLINLALVCGIVLCAFGVAATLYVTIRMLGS